MVEAHLNGVRNAIAAGWRVLEKGGTALDAVEEAVVVMEDDETFDAGRGSFLNREGKVQLDALMMDGATLRAGGVGCVEHIANPIRAARKVLSESPHVYFVGEGAERFAQEQGLPLCENKELVIPAGGRAAARFPVQRFKGQSGYIRAHDLARYRRRGGARYQRQYCRRDVDRRHAEQSSWAARRLIIDRLRMLCG